MSFINYNKMINITCCTSHQYRMQSDVSDRKRGIFQHIHRTSFSVTAISYMPDKWRLFSWYTRLCPVYLCPCISGFITKDRE